MVEDKNFSKLSKDVQTAAIQSIRSASPTSIYWLLRMVKNDGFALLSERKQMILIAFVVGQDDAFSKLAQPSIRRCLVWSNQERGVRGHTRELERDCFQLFALDPIQKIGSDPFAASEEYKNLRKPHFVIHRHDPFCTVEIEGIPSFNIFCKLKTGSIEDVIDAIASMSARSRKMLALTRVGISQKRNPTDTKDFQTAAAYSHWGTRFPFIGSVEIYDHVTPRLRDNLDHEMGHAFFGIVEEERPEFLKTWRNAVIEDSPMVPSGYAFRGDPRIKDKKLAEQKKTRENFAEFYNLYNRYHGSPYESTIRVLFPASYRAFEPLIPIVDRKIAEVEARNEAWWK